jgi:hypothetical protein
MMNARGSGVFAMACAAILIASCHRAEPSPEPQASAKPVDHLAPNELVEGDKNVFGFLLPRGAIVERWERDEATIAVDATVQQLTAYAASHVDGKPVVNAYGAKFDHVKLHADPKKILSIAIGSGPPNAQTPPGAKRGLMYLSDQSVVPEGDAGSPEDRRRQAGLTPDGRGIADPTHLQ